MDYSLPHRSWKYLASISSGQFYKLLFLTWGLEVEAEAIFKFEADSHCLPATPYTATANTHTHTVTLCVMVDTQRENAEGKSATCFILSLHFLSISQIL